MDPKQRSSYLRAVSIIDDDRTLEMPRGPRLLLRLLPLPLLFAGVFLAIMLIVEVWL